MKVSRKDIAAAAEVSTSTVGMILSGSGGRYSKATRKLVLETAEKLGYRPSINARAMRLRRSLLIGVLLNEINTHLAARFLQGVQEAIAGTDYSPLVFFSRTPADQCASLARCRQRQADGYLVNCGVTPTLGSAEELVQAFGKTAAPIIEVFGRFLPTAGKVNVDNHQAGLRCTRHLLDLGHRRIALLTHSRYELTGPHFDAWEQACGYRDAMQSAGLEPKIVGTGIDFDHLDDATFLQAGFNAFDALTHGPDAPTAVLCYEDLMAYGLNRACILHGVDVPGRLSIFGSGNQTLSAVSMPPISTTRPPHFEVGRTAASLLLRRIAGETTEDCLIAPELEPRASIAAPQSI